MPQQFSRNRLETSARTGYAQHVKPLSVVLLGACLLLGGHASALEQRIQILNPEHEQRVEMLGPDQQQDVKVVDAQEAQRLEVPDEPSASKEVAMGVAKGAVGVLSVAISLASMAAALLLM